MKWRLLGVVLVISYNAWLLWRPLNGHPEILHGFLSELAARDQPHALVFRTGDLITAVISGAGAVRMLIMVRIWPPTHRWWTVAGAGLALFAASTFYDALFAMDCASSRDPACRAAQDAGALSITHYLHSATSVGAQVGLAGSMIATVLALRREADRRRLTGRLVAALTLVEISSLLAMAIVILGRIPAVGYAQAVMISTASLFLAAVVWGLIGPPAGAASPPPTSSTAPSQR